MSDKTKMPKASVFENWREQSNVGNSTPYWLREPLPEEKAIHSRLDDLQRNGHAKLPGPITVKGVTRSRSWHT